MSYKMNKRLKKKSTVKRDVVYDDDTSSSDSDSENLQMFHQSYLAKDTTSTRKFSSSDADDETNDNTSNEDDCTSDESSGSSSEDEESEALIEGSIQNDMINSKVDKLRSQLRSLEKVNKDSVNDLIEASKTEQVQEHSNHKDHKDISSDDTKSLATSLHSQKDYALSSQNRQNSSKGKLSVLDKEKVIITTFNHLVYLIFSKSVVISVDSVIFLYNILLDGGSRKNGNKSRAIEYVDGRDFAVKRKTKLKYSINVHK